MLGFFRSIGPMALGWCALAGTLALAPPAAAQADDDASTTENAAAEALLAAIAEASIPSLFESPETLEAFLDGVMNSQLEEHHIAGATLVVVERDHVVVEKGYGYSDVSEHTPVDPETTLFRIASVSKLFTWTAIMQLVEAGAIDLDTDINSYLKTVSVPEAYGAPITLRHLLTHTPGFEDSVVGLFGRDEKSMRPLDALLADEMPKRVREPGAVSSYSNHGTALAGLVVQDVSGMPWADYIETKILQPLKMTHASVRQPLPGDLAGVLSNGYVWENGAFERKDFEYVPATPAGGLSVSAGSMAHFLIAQLNGGAYDGARILSEETTERMHSRLFAADDRINGFAHGFYEESRNGVRAIGHGGDTFWFHSEFLLIPEKSVGLFVSFNTQSSPPARAVLVDAFMDRYFPVAPYQAPPPPADFAERASRFTGTYATNRYDHSSVAKLGKLMNTISIGATPDGYLTASGGGETKKFVEVEPLLFFEVNGDDKMAFHEDATGQIDRVAFDSNPTSAFDKLRPWQNPIVQNLIPALCLLTLASLWVLPICAMIIRLYYKQPLHKPLPLSAKLIGLAGSGLCLAFGVALGVVLSDPNDIAFGPTTQFYVVMGVGIAASVAVAVMVLATLWIWARWRGGFLARVYYTVCAAAGVGLIAWMIEWNMLGVLL